MRVLVAWTCRPGYRARRVCIAMAVLLMFVVATGIAFSGVGLAQSVAPAPSVPAPVCDGPNCIPQPAPAVPPANPPGAPSDAADEEESSCGISDIQGCVSGAIESFFRDLVTPGLNSMLGLLTKSLLVTPTLDDVPALRSIWGNSQQIVIVAYATVVLVAGIVVVTHQTVQSRSSIKEVLPRVVVGFLAANLSLFVGARAIEVANALSRAVLGERISPEMAGKAISDALMDDLDNGLFVVFVALALVVMLVVVLLTYIVRITLTIILLAGAPIMLMCHALPQTEGIAFWWWKAFGGVMAIQVAQSLALVSAIRLFFSPGAIALF